MESGLFRDTASPEAEDLAMPARNKAVHARDSPIKRAKQAASPQQRGTASRNEVRHAREDFCLYFHKKFEKLWVVKA